MDSSKKVQKSEEGILRNTQKVGSASPASYPSSCMQTHAGWDFFREKEGNRTSHWGWPKEYLTTRCA
jgi:hypothetical protein